MNTSDQFVKSFARPPGWVEPEENPSSNGKAPVSKQKADHERIRWYEFPPAVIEALFSSAGCRSNFVACFAVLTASFELWYTSGRWHKGANKNPVQLSSVYLRRFKISRDRKRRALQALTEAGIIKVEYRKARESPWVTLLWKSVQE